MRKCSGVYYLALILQVLFLIFGKSNGQSNLNCTLCGCSTYTVHSNAVTIGIYITNIADLNVDATTVRMDAYLWMRWPKCTVNLDGTCFRPDTEVQIENGIQRVDINYRGLFGEPICDDTYTLVQYRLEGMFSQTLKYEAYPLDTHHLLLNFEHGTMDISEFEFVADSPNSGFSENIILPGWDISDYVDQVSRNTYKSNFGDIGNKLNTTKNKRSVYSRYSAGISITRGTNFFVFKTLPPIIIVVVVCCLVLLLDLESMETRIATGTAGILAQVFLQLSFTSAQLPKSLDYLTLIDWLFLISYVAIFMIIVECIFIHRYFYALVVEIERIEKEFARRQSKAEVDMKLERIYRANNDAENPPITDPNPITSSPSDGSNGSNSIQMKDLLRNSSIGSSDSVHQHQHRQAQSDLDVRKKRIEKNSRKAKLKLHKSEKIFFIVILIVLLILLIGVSAGLAKSYKAKF